MSTCLRHSGDQRIGVQYLARLPLHDLLEFVREPIRLQYQVGDREDGRGVVLQLHRKAGELPTLQSLGVDGFQWGTQIRIQIHT